MVKKEVWRLSKGDLTMSGVEIVSVTSGARTPKGKLDVLVRYPSGKEYTRQWWKNTMIGVKGNKNEDQPS